VQVRRKRCTLQGAGRVSDFLRRARPAEHRPRNEYRRAGRWREGIRDDDFEPPSVSRLENPLLFKTTSLLKFGPLCFYLGPQGGDAVQEQEESPNNVEQGSVS
jgi:hypothetical protein